MTKPFNNLSNSKLKKFEDIFNREIWTLDEFTLPGSVHFNIRKDFKTYSAFKSHVILLSNQNELSKDFYTMAFNFKTAAREAAEFMVSGEDIYRIFFRCLYVSTKPRTNFKSTCISNV